MHLAKILLTIFGNFTVFHFSPAVVLFIPDVEVGVPQLSRVR